MKFILNSCFLMRFQNVWIARGNAGRAASTCPHPTISVRMIFVLLSLLLLASAAKATDENEPEARKPSSSFLTDCFSLWFDRVDLAKATQPDWPSPLATTVVILKEALRYDISQQSLRDGHTLTSFGSGHGLEFIPATNMQLIVGLPAYVIEDTSPEKTGFADQTFLVKYRLRSGNTNNGNYILTAMLGLAVPNGSSAYTTHHFIFTPKAGFGKGWGRFDIQSNLGVSVPDNEAGRSRLGTPIAFNTTAQYHVASVFWPEVEVNYTYWANGRHEGLNQVFITPGLALSKFTIWKRSKFVVAAGCQIAVTDHALYHRSYILSAQFPF